MLNTVILMGRVVRDPELRDAGIVKAVGKRKSTRSDLNEAVWAVVKPNGVKRG